MRDCTGWTARPTLPVLTQVSEVPAGHVVDVNYSSVTRAPEPAAPADGPRGHAPAACAAWSGNIRLLVSGEEVSRWTRTKGMSAMVTGGTRASGRAIVGETLEE